MILLHDGPPKNLALEESQWTDNSDLWPLGPLNTSFVVDKIPSSVPTLQMTEFKGTLPYIIVHLSWKFHGRSPAVCIFEEQRLHVVPSIRAQSPSQRLFTSNSVWLRIITVSILKIAPQISHTKECHAKNPRNLQRSDFTNGYAKFAAVLLCLVFPVWLGWHCILSCFVQVNVQNMSPCKSMLQSLVGILLCDYSSRIIGLLSHWWNFRLGWMLSAAIERSKVTIMADRIWYLAAGKSPKNGTYLCRY